MYADLLPARLHCVLCLCRSAMVLRRDRRGRPYYRCAACQGIVFIQRPLQGYCLAILHNALDKADLDGYREAARRVGEETCRRVLSKGLDETAVEEVAPVEKNA